MLNCKWLGSTHRLKITKDIAQVRVWVIGWKLVHLLRAQKLWLYENKIKEIKAFSLLLKLEDGSFHFSESEPYLVVTPPTKNRLKKMKNNRVAQTDEKHLVQNQKRQMAIPKKCSHLIFIHRVWMKKLPKANKNFRIGRISNWKQKYWCFIA